MNAITTTRQDNEGPFFLFVWFQAIINFFRLIFNTSGRDLRALYRYIRCKRFLAKCERNNLTVPSLFQVNVRKHPYKPCFLYENQVWTFQDVEDLSNRVANCFIQQGFLPGDEVALFMENKPEFVAFWLGLSKIGIVTALINTNQRLQALAHSITVVKSKAIIFGSELLDAVKDITNTLQENGFKYYCYGNFDPKSFSVNSLETLLSQSLPVSPLINFEVNFSDRLFYIYTSGTTGLPKAAIIKHSRFIWLGTCTRWMLNMPDNEIYYTSLPLYHSAAGLIFVCQAVVHGDTVALRRKFSASKFWEDCITFNATVAQYIGETCRYLMAQPVQPEEKQHRVSTVIGNGLRPALWTSFCERFQIKKVGEFYGSSEGNANIINTNSTTGAVGFISRIIPSIYPVTLIKVDEATGEPIRNKDGICVKCKPGEPGEFVGKIIRNDPVRNFDGYVNKQATMKKVAKNVFSMGDLAFLSGDLMVMDENGYIYFKDRTGDTFRWKGENVSTMEVEAAISQVLGLTDCVAYGVVIPGTEGRAGMGAIIDIKCTIDFDTFAQNLKKLLPLYAMPIFLRIVKNLESTGTYKFKKINLQHEGYDLKVVKDPLYYLNTKTVKYTPLDEDVYQKILSRKMRF
ncbi:long-chain fatty acid transport protein 4-like isoform X1 [Limulus polyphemus]|uniref:Long-chain-fatty-acid--CoA ligase n=1 Tax=Limulus polyphemus TaxID=6850 RepID=A0ABM1S6Q7_LIMPO|nr:long-chain fatty acid transport protein 4-like isoform X1 [Limulus polyphemus]